MNTEELAIIAALIRSRRVAALGTSRNDGPFVSMVAYAAEPDFGGFLLLAAPQSSLLICEPDDGRDDVQTLVRITLVGETIPIPAASAEHAAARACYLARLAAAAPLFDFPDFALFRLVPSEARYVGGFARAYTLTPEHLRQSSQI
jgi:heme iron utilization protein